MRRTSRSFLKVGTILGFIIGGLLLIVGFVAIFVGTTRDYKVIEPYVDLINQFFGGSVKRFQDAATFYGVFAIIAGLSSIASAIFCIIARNKPQKGLFITVIVLCAIGGSVFGLLGAIFGLVANAQEKRVQQPAPAVEAKPEPEPKEEEKPLNETKD